MSEASSPAWAPGRAELRAAFDARVLELVRERGPISWQELRVALGYAQHAEHCNAMGALQRLQRAGLVVSGPSKWLGSRTVYRATGAAT